MHELKLSGRDLYDLMGGFFRDHNTCSLKIQCMGHSMSPFIRDKNIVTLKPLSPDFCLRKGDIVAAAVHAGKRVIIHRIVTALPPEYLIKGDNNHACDGWFHEKDILGIVQKIETPAGIGYTPRHWQNFIIALGSKANILRYAFLPGLGFLKT